MAITITIDNDRTTSPANPPFDPLIVDESTGTQTSGTTDTGNEIDISLSNPVGGTLSGFLTPFNNFLNNVGNVLSTTFGLTLGDAQRVFAAAKDGASSSADFVKITASNGEIVNNLFFSDSAGAALDGDQVFISAGNPLKTLSGDNIYLWSAGDFAIATTSATAGGGRIVAAFYLNDSDPNHLQAQVQMVTFEALKHPDPTNPDDSVNFTDVLQVSAQGTLSFNFDNLPSGSFLYAAVGNTAAGLLVTGQDLNVQTAGPKLGELVKGGSDPSDSVNTSQGGIGATIGVNSQHFTDVQGSGGAKIDGPLGVFTLVKGFTSYDATVNGTSQGTGTNVTEIGYTDYVNAPSAKIFISQVTGSSSLGGAVRISLWEAGGGDGGIADHATNALTPEQGAGTTRNAYIGNNDTDQNVKDDWAVVAGSVTVKRGATTYTWTSANSGTAQGGITVTIDSAHPNTFTITGLVTSDTIGFSAANDLANLLDGTFNRFDVQALANSNPVDIGRIDLDQGVSISHSVGDQLVVQDDGPTLSGTTITHAVGEDAMAGAGAGDLSTGNPDAGDTKTDEVSYTYAEIAGLVNAGTDSPALSSLTTSFVANTAVRDIDNNAVMSKGEAVFWAVSGGVVQGVTATARVVFTITNDVANSEYDVDLKDQIDHPTASGDEGVLTLNLTPAFQATDKDLDPATLTGNLVKLDVENDVPIPTNNLVSGTVDEDGVIENVAAGLQSGDGIAGGPAGAGSFADVAGQDVLATGSIASLFTVGADEPLTYSLSAVTTGLPSLFSGGVAVLYSVSGNTLTAYRTGGNPATQTDQVFIFSITDASTGAYSFTLIDQLDHASLDGLDGDNLENDLLIQLGSILRATDKDGDTITYSPASDFTNGLVITVDDDTPTQNNTLVGNSVDEDGVIEDPAAGTQTGDGIAGGPAGAGSFADLAGQDVTVTGSIAALFNSGADEALVYGISGTTSGLPSLFSGGVAVLYSVSGNTLTAYRTGGNPATQTDQVFQFSITNTSTGAYSFTLIDQLDHPTLDGLGAAGGDNLENDLLIQLGSILQATDKDGDTITYVPTGTTNGLVITVDDDTPTQNNLLLSGTVDEDGVIENVAVGLQNGDGIAGGPAGGGSFADFAGEPVQVTGSIAGLFNSGADEALVYGISGTTSGLPSLFSGGVAVLYSVSGNTLTAYRTGGNPATQTDQVFIFSITDTATGDYSFTLIDQLDHASLDGVAGDNLENDLLIQLGSILQATDKDGDTITYVPAGDNSNGLVITVDDDTPTAVAGATVSHEVQEDALTGGNTPDTGDSETKSVTATYTSTELNTLVNSGADADMSFSLNTAASGTAGAVIGTNVVTTDDAAVLSGGVNVTWAAGAGGSLRGITTVGGVVTTIFTLAPSGSNFVFTLADQIDHSGAENDQENLGIDLTKAFIGNDFDHDAVTFNADSIIMNVENDLPVFTAQIESKTLDWIKDAFVTRTLNGKVGADDPASYTIDKYTDLAGYTENLSLDGKTLTYVKDSDGKTYFTLQLSDSANTGAGSYTFTVNQPPPLSVTHFSFLDMPSGQNLQAVIAKDKTHIDLNGPGGADDTLPDGGILVLPTNPVLKADGTYSNASGTINTSQGGGNVTIGNGNQAFDKAGDGAWFVFVDNPLKSDVGGYASGQGGIDQNTADDADSIGFTGFIESRDSSVKIVQASGGASKPGPEMHITAYESHIAGTVGGNTTDRAFVNDPTAANLVGSHAAASEVNVVGVIIKNAAGTVIETRILNQTTGVAELAAGSADSAVGIRFNLDVNNAGTADDIYSAFISNLAANYTVEFLTATDHNMAKVEWVSGSFDIGGFDLIQGNDTPDVNFEFSVAIQDRDADLMHYGGSTQVFDDFRITVDGTGVNNQDPNVDPLGFTTSYDSFI